MRRKSIGASQAFHEPMSTGAFLEFLTGMQGWLVGQVFRGLGLGPAAEMLERRREPRLSQLRLRKPSNAPQGQRIDPCVWQEISERGGIQAPGACGQVSRGLVGPFPHKNHHLSNYDFFANLLAGAWRRRGCRLKRLLRRWGPGGKRSRDTPPYPPPPTLPVFWGCKGERKRVFTLSAFGNHPTRPPRSADPTTLKP